MGINIIIHSTSFGEVKDMIYDLRPKKTLKKKGPSKVSVKAKDEFGKIKDKIIYRQNAEGNCATLSLINSNIILNTKKGENQPNYAHNYYASVEKCMTNHGHNLDLGFSPVSQASMDLHSCVKDYENQIGYDGETKVQSITNMVFWRYLKDYCPKKDAPSPKRIGVSAWFRNHDPLSAHVVSIIRCEKIKNFFKLIFSDPHDPGNLNGVILDKQGKVVAAPKSNINIDESYQAKAATVQIRNKIIPNQVHLKANKGKHRRKK